MEAQSKLDYSRIEKAIAFLKTNYLLQPSLDEIAAHVNLSPFHFQRMFKKWAVISPKEFIQYLSIEHAKTLLKETSTTLFETAFQTGLSGTGRLHDLFIKIEGMTPGEYKNGGAALKINYSFADTPFGAILVAATSKGICYMAFADMDEQSSLSLLKQRFPNAVYHNFVDQLQQDALYIFTRDWSKLDGIKLHLKGTSFQLKVWQALLKVPESGLTTYIKVADAINHPKASRAVGTAVGANPVAYLIPCHRVIKATGETGQYHWGTNRKIALLGWEAAKSFNKKL